MPTQSNEGGLVIHMLLSPSNSSRAHLEIKFINCLGPKASGDLPGHIFFHKLVIGKEEIDLLHLVETSPGYSCVM